MRLHSVTITAFGPFAETAYVDFDALGEGGVFLLCGDTGAGKTTVLDAVCFALYGDLPSDRGAAKQLRSHFAAEGVRPEVVLEAELSGRRLRFSRSPGWQRPKRRGTGTTAEQPRVLVEERTGSDWSPLTNRLEEAGQLVADLLGMTLAQFSQVVLLPQGQFDTFLSARSEDRQKVLTRLFRTRRFEEVERWLGERRRTLRRESDQHRERVTTLLQRTAELTGVEPPEDLAPDALARESGAARRWLDALLASTDLLHERATEALAVAVDERDTAETELDVARSAHALRERHDRAVRVLADLEEHAAGAETDRASLAAARRAATVRPLVRVAEQAADGAAEAHGRAARAVEEIAPLLAAYADPDRTDSTDGPADAADGADLAELAERADRAATLATEQATVARLLVPRARELSDLGDQVLRARSRLAVLDGQRDELEGHLRDLPDREAALTERVEQLRERATALAPARERLELVRGQRADLARLVSLREQLREATEQRDVARELRLAEHEALLTMRETRLQGMAAELATTALAAGEGCPVCGSCLHPSPAVPADSTPTRDDERAQQSRVDDAVIALDTREDRVRGLERTCHQLAGALGSAAEDPTRLDTEHAAAQQELSAAEEATAALEDLGRERDRVRDDLEGARARLVEVRSSLASCDSGLDTLLERVAAVTAELEVLLAGEPTSVEGVGAVARRHEAAVESLARARDLLGVRRRTSQDAAAARERARSAAETAGFAGPEDAEAAWLDDEQCQRLQDALADRAARETHARAELEDPEVRAAAGTAAPDVTALAAKASASLDRHAAASAQARAVTERRSRLRTRDHEVTTALAAWAPVREELEVATSLAELAEGRGGDNTHQMRLSAYVLSARLSQVVAAANERLVDMTAERYLLEHSAMRAVGDRRGGLSLRVRDQWTDELRDPVTLSGGETFVVSLALALGLADVVTGEAGGTRVDTLFVDEGFGSLDADTLELVMDALDQLREGGRVVGVVSHVAELRSRIGTQLLVRKTRRGSSVELQRVTA